MYSVSRAYKEAMNAQIRNHGYMTISIGVVNQEAQGSSKFVGDYAYWSNKTLPFTNKEVTNYYATMENNFFKADGSMYFMPENDELAQFTIRQGLTTANYGDSVKVTFDNVYNIKGLTINFGIAYPTRFLVKTDNNEFEFENYGQEFVTTENLGETSSVIIKPISMVGGQQRFRINKILMGVGINFSNDDIINASHEEFVNAVTQEIPYVNFYVNVSDENNVFNVDNENSFINYLQTGQTIEYSVGLELDNGEVEFIPMGVLFLDDWKSSKGKMYFSAKDRFTDMDDTYSDGNYIHERSLYTDAVAVLTSAGLQADEYQLDECLKDVIITNPLPEVSHAECLQLIANAGRCKLYQNRKGLICIQANFATVIDPYDYVVSTDTQSDWSKPSNIMFGSDIVYADMTQNFFSADGSMFFLTEDGNYMETSFVSRDIADSNGSFQNNPNFTITLPAGYVYYSLYAKFDGNAPQEMLVTTYRNGAVQETITFSDMDNENWLSHEFKIFDAIKCEFTKASPNNRVLVNKIAFGELTDYTIKRNDMLENPIGYQEKKTKDVLVKMFTFENDEAGRPQEVDDYNFYTHSVNTSGQTVTFENPLIHTAEHAKSVAEWLGNYYANNIAYDVKYRGEPRLNASDIVRLESEVKGNLQVEIETLQFTFNGAFGGNLSLRRAFKNNGGTNT